MEAILQVLKPTFILQRMLDVFIMLTPGRQNMIINCATPKVQNTVLAILDVKTRWNSTLQLHKCPYRVGELSDRWPKNPKYSNDRRLLSTQYK